MSWLDGDMRRKDQRTLLSWRLAGAQADKRRSLLGAGWFSASPTRTDRRRSAAQRSRNLAEHIEGVSPLHDQSHNGTGTFGRVKLLDSLNYWMRRGGR
jgi:hypothetical protein